MGIRHNTHRWLESLSVYLDRRMLALGFLGFSSGLPRLLVYSTLAFWLLDVGLTIEAVGLFAATALPYNLKVFWAPVLDRLPLPVLTKHFGLRRGWMLLIQTLLALSIAGLSGTDPASAPVVCAAMAVAVAIFSASQDVVIDAYRVERLEDEEQGAGAAVAVFGYRVGMLVASAGALYIAAFTESWPATYLVMAACMGVGLLTTLLSAEPEATPAARARKPMPLREHVRDAVIGPLRDFASRSGWGAVLLFVLLYKVGEALAGTMTNQLLVDLGFEKMEIANIAKTYGLIASIVGVLLGGWVVRRTGIVRALWIGGILQLLSNLMFSWQAVVGRDVTLLTATIGVENLTGGLGTAAFVAYLSALCNKTYTATQYALLTAISSLLHTVLSTPSGFMATSLGWPTYFVVTAIAAAPGLIALSWLGRRRWIGFESSRGTSEK